MSVWVVVPAAGVGHRFGAEIPKQYQMLSGQKVIERTLGKLLSLDPKLLVVAVHPDDKQWQQLSISQHQSVHTVNGGNERADSVLAAVNSLHNQARENDWVLVHDVARPCVRVKDIHAMLDKLADHPVGGILATPISDTVKRVSSGSLEIKRTEDRSQLWSAQTPQMFRYGLLKKALKNSGPSVTDEASAVEQLGFSPVVLEGSRDNIKITRQEDMSIAEAIIQFQDRLQESGQ